MKAIKILEALTYMGDEASEHGIGIVEYNKETDTAASAEEFLNRMFGISKPSRGEFGEGKWFYIYDIRLEWQGVRCGGLASLPKELRPDVLLRTDDHGGIRIDLYKIDD